MFRLEQQISETSSFTIQKWKGLLRQIFQRSDSY